MDITQPTVTFDPITGQAIRSFELPNFLFAHGDPYRCDYIGVRGEGIAYKLSPEQDAERRAATGTTHPWVVISLCSPYITGLPYPNAVSASELAVYDLDLDNRAVALIGPAALAEA